MIEFTAGMFVALCLFMVGIYFERKRWARRSQNLEQTIKAGGETFIVIKIAGKP